ncbi:MAG: YdeI/OmpD-associated family protein [Pseudomonadota bacterium]
MSGFFTHEFESVLAEFGVGKTRKVWYRVVFMPAALEAELPFDRYPRLRIDGEINDVPIANAFIPTGDGRRYLIVSPEVIKTAGLQIGDLVTTRFRIADQDHVDVPDELNAALEQDKAARSQWDALTPGKKRALAFHVAGAKTAPTIEKRIKAVLVALREKQGRLR